MMEKFFTKITSLILAMMILMSSMSTTIVYAVEELEGENNSITESTNTTDEESGSLQNELKDETTNNANEKEENNESLSSSTEDSSKQVDNTGTDEENNSNGEENSTYTDPGHTLRLQDTNPVRMLSLENTDNTQNIENQGEQSVSNKNNVSIEINATTKQDIEVMKANNNIKSRNDEYEIRIFESSFISGASKDSNGNLVWTANNSSAGHEFTFRVSYATSGLKELPPKAIQITMPKQILRDRAGNLADEFTMSLPTLEEYEEENGTTELVYKEDGDYIIAYNPKEVTAAVNGYFEIAYSTSKPTFDYKDYDKANTGLITEGGTASDPFYAIMSINVGDETLNSITDDTNLFIDTTAKLTSTQKRYPSIYRSWNPLWMEETPNDSEDYYYLVWEIQSYISVPTQMYKFTLEDFVTDLTEGTTGEDYELVGYKLSGEKYYSQKSTQVDQTISGYRYDYVLTRHKISTYAPISYRLKNTVIATVSPIDGVDSDTKQTSFNIFNWDPSFAPPTGHFNIYKYGNNNWHNKFGYHWDYANYDLDKLQNSEETGVNELKGFKYYTETTGYAYPWTLKDGGSSQNPLDYGINNVNYETWDDTLYLEGDEIPMNTADYYLEYLTYNIENKDADFDEFNMSFNQKTATYDDNEVITFYAKFGDRNEQSGNEWIQIGTYNLKTVQLIPNSDYVSEMTTSKITFKESVHATGWKFTTTNKHYYTNISATPYFVLTNSEYVKEKIADKNKIKIENNVNTKITDHNENIIFSKTNKAYDYARVTYYSSDITKDVASVSNNRAKKIYTITWKVNAWEKATSGTGEAEYVWQDSGIFYDLIPLGGTIDVDSIQVKTQDGFLDENEYLCEVIENYNMSGRAMVIIRIKEEAQYYTVFYNTLHTWDSMKDYGRNVLNPVAYETGNEKITNGYPDDGGNLSLLNKIFYDNLDKTTDDKKFIYAEATHTINSLTAAASGLDKKVKAEKDSSYSYSTIVEPEGTYSYKLRYQNTYMNKAKNLIWYDSLENFEIVDSTAGTSQTSSWYGTVQSVDVTQLVNKGIDVKVYISTIEKLNLEENNDLTNESVWQMVTEGTNLEQAKAIAIDITKTTSGEDFVLDSGDSVTATIHMKAPSEISEEMEENPYTYNNVYIKNTIIDSLDSSEDYFIHQDYTKVKYRVIADVPFYKVNEQNQTEGIKGITFRLFGTSRYGTDMDLYATSDKNGYIVFKDIEAGTYTLQEYEGLIDWVEDHTEHEVKIDIHKNVYIDDQLIIAPDTIKITNTPRIHTDVVAYKKDLVSKAKLVKGAKFKLEGTSDYGNEILMYATSNEEGKLTFTNLEKGKYELTEMEAPDGYIIGEEVYQVVVDENANYNVLLKSDDELSPTYENGKYNIYNEPLHKFTIVKKDSYDGSLIVGAKFRVHGVSNYGTSYDKEVTSVAGGLVVFDNLEAGTYILQETFVPEITDDEGNTITYILDENKYIVTIKKDGTVTVEGLEKNQYGNFEFYNDRNKGQITITKEWIDDKTNEERAEPTINISTEKPHRTTYVYFRNNNNGSDSALYYIKNDYSYRSKITGEFSRNTTLTEDEVVALGATRLDIDYNNQDAEYKIYAWIDENGNCYWWSNAEVALLTDNSNGLFYYLSNMKSINLTGINTGNVENMSSMFYNCRNLTSLDISNLDTSNVTNMSEMFSSCSGLTSLDISNLDTSKVTDMSEMFRYCSGLTSLDVSDIDTSNVTDMSYMFYGCSGLTSLDVSQLDTSNVTDMSEMFSSCRGLTSLDVSDIDTSKVTDMSHMFHGCSGLTSLDVSNLNTGKVTDMTYMFSECNGLTSLDVSQLDTSNVTDMSEMFSHCSGLTSLEVSNLDTSKVTDMSRMFSHCSGLTSLDVSQLDTSNVTAMTGMFRLCSGLTSLDVSQLDTSNVTSMGEMFNSCSGLTSLDVSNLDTSNVTSMYQMFRSCSGLTSLDVSNLDTSNVTSMSGMFSGCSKLTSLDVSNLDTSNVTDMSQMFRSCSGLTSLDVSNLNTGKVTDMSRMFNGCSGLTSLDVSNLNTSKVTKMTYMFSECNGLTSLDLSNFDTANVANMAYMFNECRKLTDLNVSNLDTSKVTDMNSMFRVCQELTILDVSNFDTSKVTDMRYMLYSCHKLKTIYASNKFIAPTKSALMFSGCSNLVGGNGTIYNNSYSNNGDYARIDTAETPGYFTEKATQTGAVNANSMNLLTTDNLIYDDTSITISKTNYLQTTYMLAGNTIGEDEDDSTNPITYSTANTNYDDQGNETHWVKDGNIWTYTFYVDDPHATWFVWEEPVAEGYISNYTIDNPGQVENQQAKIVNYKYDDSSSGSSSDDENITIKYGSLAISKTLKDASGNVISSDSDNTEFTVIVNLTAPAGYESLISGTKVFGNYVFKDGTGTIKLRAGQTITIPGIVAGTTYSVSEKGLNGYESSCDSSSGTISNEEASTVTYINTKSYEEQDGSTQPSSKYVDIKIEKVVSGQFEDNDEHKFEITLSNLVAYQTYTIKKYLSTVGTTEIEEFTYVADDTGSANITINLKNEEQVVLKDIPVGSKYKVFEYAGNYISSYSIIDGNDSGLINSTANINTKENRSLSTAIETADEGEDITITFTNKKSVTQNLKLVKEVTDENDKNSYIFEIVFSNMPEGTSFNSSVGKVTADQYGMAELTIYLAGGEEVEFYNIPVGTKYNVTELASTAITSYTIVDNNGLNKIEKISEANSKPKTALSTELETVNQGEEATITFINDTTNIDEEDAQDSVEVTIGVTKIVINENEEVAEDCEDIFAFELKAKDENNPMPDKSTSDDEDELSENQQSNSEASRVVSIKGNGTASFGTIVFTKTGTYVYTITEIVKDSEDYTYDKTTYTVVYEVTNPNGLLEVTKTVTKNGFRGDVITFTNIQRDKTSEDEPSGDSKEPEEENKSEESKESSENKENNKENTNNAQANNVKTGDVIVIYIANIIVVGAILLISIKCRRK